MILNESIVRVMGSGKKTGKTQVRREVGTGSEEREVSGVGSIPVAILPSCQDIKTCAY